MEGRERNEGWPEKEVDIFVLYLCLRSGVAENRIRFMTHAAWKIAQIFVPGESLKFHFIHNALSDSLTNCQKDKMKMCVNLYNSLVFLHLDITLQMIVSGQLLSYYLFCFLAIE